MGISPLWYYFNYYYYLPVESPTQTDICEINWKIFSFDDDTIVGEIAEIQIDFDQRPFHICLPFLSNIISTSTSHVSIFSFQFSMFQLLSTTWLVNFDVIINFFAIFFILSISCSSYVLTNSEFLTNFCENQLLTCDIKKMNFPILQFTNLNCCIKA